MPLLAAAASLAEFEAALAAQDSATAALRQWCEVHRIADPAGIRATHLASATSEPPTDLRARLELPASEGFVLRHVRLSCGETTLSEAYNWYVPARLTPAMNEALATSNAPFGTVAAPLKFRRERLALEDWQRTFCPADAVLIHSAMLRLPDGRALALLVECYTPAVLSAPAVD